MEQKDIEYRPGKHYTWFILPMVASGLVGCVMLYVAILQKEIVGAIFGVIMTFAALTVINYLHRLSKITVIFESGGLRLINDRVPHRYIAWSELSYAYYIRNFKGYIFIILSPVKLSWEEQKRYLRKNSNLGIIYHDQMIVIPPKPLRGTEEIDQIISENIPNVECAK